MARWHPGHAEARPRCRCNLSSRVHECSYMELEIASSPSAARNEARGQVVTQVSMFQEVRQADFDGGEGRSQITLSLGARRSSASFCRRPSRLSVRFLHCNTLPPGATQQIRREIGIPEGTPGQTRTALFGSGGQRSVLLSYGRLYDIDHTTQEKKLPEVS